LNAILERVIAKDGVAAAVKTYRDLRSQYLTRGAYDFSDRSLNFLAERLLRSGQTGDAKTLLELNTEYNPDSTWAHYQLGNARLAAGDRTGALEAFERSLALDQGNDEARKKVEELKGASPKP